MRDGDAPAGADAAALYERYSARVHTFCRRRLGDEQEAADAAQDTFLNAWLALRKGAQIRDPLPWLLTIADNVCTSRFRARGARVVTTELSDGVRAAASEASGDVADLAAALRTLPQRQRQALLRRELQGYSYDEISAELGVSRASVAALLHRARSAVAERLRQARGGVGALVPVPTFLRSWFENGAAGIATGTAAAAIVVSQLAGALPASPSTTPRPPLGGVAPAGEAGHGASASRARARATRARVAGISKVAGRYRMWKTPAARLDDGDGFPLATRHIDLGEASTSPLLPRPKPSPEGGPGPSSDPPGGPDIATEAAPQEPTPPAGEDQDPEEEAPPRGRSSGPGAGRGTPPGHQPKGSKGHSASAPGQGEPGPGASGSDHPGGNPGAGGEGEGHGQGQGAGEQQGAGQPPGAGRPPSGDEQPPPRAGPPEGNPASPGNAPGPPDGPPDNGHEPGRPGGGKGNGSPPGRP
jgi:RNA polymerase sigma factor (sigma-70 family)